MAPILWKFDATPTYQNFRNFVIMSCTTEVAGDSCLAQATTNQLPLGNAILITKRHELLESILPALTMTPMTTTMEAIQQTTLSVVHATLRVKESEYKHCNKAESRQKNPEKSTKCWDIEPPFNS
jgi:hypothetical protein